MSLKEQGRLFEISRNSIDFVHFFPQKSLETVIDADSPDISYLAVDLLKQEVIFNVVRLAATIIICIGFLLMLLPEEWDEITLRFINSLKEKKGEEHVEDITDSSVHLRSRSRANGTVSIPLA